MSIFIDESGDFGPFEKHSPFYVLSLVFHDQSDDIAVGQFHRWVAFGNRHSAAFGSPEAARSGRYRGDEH